MDEFTEEEKAYFEMFPIVADGVQYDISDLFTESEKTLADK